MEGIANEICPNTNISVGLFFHVNCTEALEPEEVISSGESGPYAVNTILGWCGWGQYPVLVKMAGLQNFGKHHFCIINEVKDTENKDMLSKIYHAGFLNQSNQESLIRC